MKELGLCCIESFCKYYLVVILLVRSLKKYLDVGPCLLSGVSARDVTSWCSWINIKGRVFLFSLFEAVVSIGTLITVTYGKFY